MPTPLKEGFIESIDDLLARAKRGERTHPITGALYGIVVTFPDGEQDAVPVEFHTPEEAAMFLVEQMIPIMQVVLPEGEYRFAIGIFADVNCVN